LSRKAVYERFARFAPLGAAAVFLFGACLQFLAFLGVLEAGASTGAGAFLE